MHNEDNWQSVEQSESLIYSMFLFVQISQTHLLTQCIFSCRFRLTVTQLISFLLGFLQSRKKQARLPAKTTGLQHAKGYPKGTYHAQENPFTASVLFVSTCNMVIDHLWKCVVDKHVEYKTHARNVQRNLFKKQVYS